MWLAGVAMMVMLCLGGLVGGGFFMHKHEVGKDTQTQATKDAQRQIHEHEDTAVISEDKSKGTYQPMMQTDQEDIKGNRMPAEGSGDRKGIAEESEMEYER